MEGADPLTAKVVGAAAAAHKALGPGPLESACRACLRHKLGAHGFAVDAEVPAPPAFRGRRLECGCRFDLPVEQAVVVEVSPLRNFFQFHESGVLACLLLARKATGLLVNFSSACPLDGIKRMVL